MRYLVVILILVLTGQVRAQSSYYTQGHKAYDIMERMDIRFGGIEGHHAAIKYFQRDEVFTSLTSRDDFVFNAIESKDLAFIIVDNTFDTIQGRKGRSFWSNFYKTKGHFFEVNTPDFKLVLNPIFNFRFGKENDTDDLIFQNTRGLELYGKLDHKLYFYTNLLETQAHFNNFISNRIEQYKSIPGQGFYKPYTSGLSDKINGFDFANAQAYLGYQISKHASLELGHSKHFFGHGYRSLLLSDYATNYFHLKFNVKVWKIHYQTIFAELAPISAQLNIGDNLLSKKYMATHYLSFKPQKNIELGLFETIVFGRENHFEFQYLNPIILYRTVEFLLDSPDNVIIGLNGKITLMHSLSLYGQLVFDEFKIGELTGSEGWWGNKYGLQFGAKWIDIGGLSHLDGQVEYNIVRPFTYSHNQALEEFSEVSTGNYSHYLQPLAHPLGSNFSEFILALKYRPHTKLFLQSQFFLAKKGQNTGGVNLGGDIILPNNTREGDYGHSLFQGEKETIKTWRLRMGYEVFHNMFWELDILFRDNNAPSNPVNTKYIGTGIRFNIGNYRIDY